MEIGENGLHLETAMHHVEVETKQDIENATIQSHLMVVQIVQILRTVASRQLPATHSLVLVRKLKFLNVTQFYDTFQTNTVCHNWPFSYKEKHINLLL